MFMILISINVFFAGVNLVIYIFGGEVLNLVSAIFLSLLLPTSLQKNKD